MADREFQVIRLFGIRHGTAGKERAADKGALFLLIIDVGTVDAQIDVAILVSVMLKDLTAFFGRGHRDGKGTIAAALALEGRDHLALCLEQSADQKDKMRENIFVFCFEYDAAGCKLSAEQEHRVQLAVLQRRAGGELLTDLPLCIG